MENYEKQLNETNALFLFHIVIIIIKQDVKMHFSFFICDN